ncbi:TetR/AcrR family transcriptional regulator [Lysobacter korlensis]|uniref:TetR/AcrR family transcriptional regulator n=1 Tax=Lysobacter korlensis TaxID=553636 RepID=A0ABV6RQP8_9GAMM
MSEEVLPPAAGDEKRLLRNAPVQARSAARLAALLDAAASTLDDVGMERLTTALVAERAGASIGTVYRYFPDRVTLLQALAERNLQRLEERIDAAIPEAVGSALDALGTVADVVLDMFRTEPGFRSIRLGDVLDLRDAGRPEPAKARLARSIADAMTVAYDDLDAESLTARLDIALEVLDALITRAFVADPAGDERFLVPARRAFLSLVDDRVLAA